MGMMATEFGGTIEQVGVDGYADVTDRHGLVIIAMIGAPAALGLADGDAPGVQAACEAFLREFGEMSEMLAGADVSFAVCDLGTNRTIATIERIASIPAAVLYLDGRRVRFAGDALGSIPSLLLAIADVMGEMAGR